MSSKSNNDTTATKNAPTNNTTTTNAPNRTDYKKEIADLVSKRAELMDSLVTMEREIYSLEGDYLDDTHLYGNIIRGWEKYLNSNRSTAEKTEKRNRKLKEQERLFSKSSITSMNAVCDFSSDFEDVPIAQDTRYGY